MTKIMRVYGSILLLAVFGFTQTAWAQKKTEPGFDYGQTYHKGDKDKFRQHYTQGEYRTRVEVMTGKVFVAPYDRKGIKQDQAVVIGEGQNTVQTTVPLPAKIEAPAQVPAKKEPAKEEAVKEEPVKEKPVEEAVTSAEQRIYQLSDQRINTRIVDTMGQIVMTRQDLVDGKIQLSCRLSAVDRVAKILFSEDNGSAWKELRVAQNIVYSFVPMDQREYVPLVRVVTDDGHEAILQVFSLGTSIKFKNIDDVQLVVDATKAIADSYEARDAGRFSRLIARDFYGDKAALEQGARLDFDLFTDIHMVIYISKITKAGNDFSVDTRWEKSQTPQNTGEVQRTTGMTTILLAPEDGVLKIKDLKGNLLYATLSPIVAQTSGLPADVVTQISEAQVNREPIQPGADKTENTGGTGAITVTSPNGNENWAIATVQNITWTLAGIFSTVALDYSTNSGSTYPNSIVASTDAAVGSYSWTIPASPSSAVRVRVRDTTNASIYDTSNLDFRIYATGPLTITFPAGGEVLIVGSSYNITWTVPGGMVDAKLEYSINGGVTFPNLIVASTIAAAGSYSWTIPDTIGVQNRVRISDVANPPTFATSGSSFAIKGSFTLTSPNGGEVWLVSDAHNITWTRQGSIANADIWYSTDGGATFPSMVIAATSAAAGSYAWSIPNAISTLVRVRISDSVDATVSDISDSDFKISGRFTITSPNGAEVWTVSTAQNITWLTVGAIPNVKLVYSTDGGATFSNIIVASAANSGSYAWNIPDSISAQARVRISDIADPTTFDTSDSNFKIAGQLVLTSPNGGETWNVATTHNITWMRVGSIANVSLEYSINNGASYTTIIASTPAAALTYAWTVPNDPSPNCLIRIFDASDPAVNDASNAVFTIP